jgi:hypothetical protein
MVNALSVLFLPDTGLGVEGRSDLACIGSVASTNDVADLGVVVDSLVGGSGKLWMIDSEVESESESVSISMGSSPQSVMSLSRADERSALILTRRGLQLGLGLDLGLDEGMSLSASLSRWYVLGDLMSRAGRRYLGDDNWADVVMAKGCGPIPSSYAV